MSPDFGLLLASIPSPDRGVWHLGPLPIRAYALCIIAGIIVSIWWAERRFVARGGQPGTVVDIAVYAVPFGLVGGRLYHVLTDWSKYFGEGGHPLDALKIWEGGLGIWGAITLGGVGAWIGARRRGIPLPFVADAAAPGIVAGQAIGRIGNWFNQELFGRDTTLPWGLEIYRRIDPATGTSDTLRGVAVDQTPVQIVHPTFLYELLWNLGVAALVVWADRRFRLGHGRAFALYVAGYCAGRFWIELLRTDTATMVFGVRINVITAAVVFLGAVAYLLYVRGERETLAATAPGGEADGAASGTVAQPPGVAGAPASAEAPDSGEAPGSGEAAAPGEAAGSAHAGSGKAAGSGEAPASAEAASGEAPGPGEAVASAEAAASTEVPAGAGASGSGATGELDEPAPSPGGATAAPPPPAGDAARPAAATPAGSGTTEADQPVHGPGDAR